jgi:hypothetical protein
LYEKSIDLSEWFNDIFGEGWLWWLNNRSWWDWRNFNNAKDMVEDFTCGFNTPENSW